MPPAVVQMVATAVCQRPNQAGGAADCAVCPRQRSCWGPQSLDELPSCEATVWAGNGYPEALWVPTSSPARKFILREEAGSMIFSRANPAAPAGLHPKRIPADATFNFGSRGARGAFPAK